MENIKHTTARNIAVCAALATLITLGVVAYRRETKGMTSVTPCKGKDNFLGDALVPRELILSEDTPGVFFGKVPGEPGVFVGKPLYDDGHIVVVGPTGSGKSGGILNISMETAHGFTVFLDVKRTLYKRWKALHGSSGKMCYNFDPWDEISGNCWFDVFALMKAHPAHAVEYARQIANTLIPVHGQEANEIWLRTSAAFTTGMIIYCFHHGLSFIDTMLIISQHAVDELIDMVMKSNDGEAKTFISKFQGMEQRTIAGIGMELESYLAAFAGSSVIRKALSPSSGKIQLSWETLNRRIPADVILTFPEAEYSGMRSLFCLMVNQLMTSLARRPERTHDQNELPPVLVLLDEFPVLGRVDSISQGMQTLRSRGVTIAIFLQSFASLDLLYGRETARVIRDNCNYQVYFGANDVESRKQMSDLIGTTAVIREGTSEGVSVLGNIHLSYNRSRAEDRIPIVLPEALQMLTNPIIVSPYGTFSVQRCMAFNGDLVLSKPCGHLMPTAGCYSTLTDTVAQQGASSAASSGVELSKDFQKAAQKLKESSEARRRENSHDDTVDLFGGLQGMTTTVKDMDDPLFSVMGQLGTPI